MPADSYTRSTPGTLYAARVYRNSTQSVATGTLVTVSYNTERWDFGGLWSAGSPTRLTVPVAGMWYFEAFWEWNSNESGAGERFADLYLNGTTIIAELSTSGADVSDTATPIHTGGGMWRCAVGDYVECRVYQTSGATMTNAASTATLAHKCDFGATLIMAE